MFKFAEACSCVCMLGESVWGCQCRGDTQEGLEARALAASRSADRRSCPPVILQAPAATSVPPRPAAPAPVAAGTGPTTAAGMQAPEHIPFHAYEPRTATEVANRTKDTAEDLAEAARSAPAASLPPCSCLQLLQETA